jgi:LemA protein
MTLYIIIGIVVIVGIWFAASYNGFVRLVNGAKEAWSDIDVQLKRRYDLIPNLVNSVKGYAKHESSVFENVTQARSAAMGAQSPEEKGKAEGALAASLKSVFAIAEAYPELKANENFLALQAELSKTEDTVQASRRFYNGNVRELNTKIGSFPSNVIAGMFKLSKMEFFAADEAEKANVEVKF